jgi:hypothetical protein
MVSCFAHFISPSSSRRAKLSIHLIATETSRKSKELAKESASVTGCAHTTSVDEGSRNPAAQIASPIRGARIAGGLQSLRSLEHRLTRDDPEMQNMLNRDMIIAPAPQHITFVVYASTEPLWMFTFT